MSESDLLQILCAASVNYATFIDDCIGAVSVVKDSDSSLPQKTDSSISLIWIVTGVPNLTKVGVVGVWSIYIHVLLHINRASRWVWLKSGSGCCQLGCFHE